MTTYTINNTTVPNVSITSGGFASTGSTVTLNTGAGGAGQIYTTNGTTGATNWVTPSNPYDAVMKINQTNPPTIEVKGNMVINGVDLEERLNTIEKVLSIPERDVIIEKKHPKLKKLYDEYIHALAKYRTFEAIKGDDDVT